MTTYMYVYNSDICLLRSNISFCNDCKAVYSIQESSEGSTKNRYSVFSIPLWREMRASKTRYPNQSRLRDIWQKKCLHLLSCYCKGRQKIGRGKRGKKLLPLCDAIPIVSRPLFAVANKP